MSNRETIAALDAKISQMLADLRATIEARHISDPRRAPLLRELAALEKSHEKIVSESSNRPTNQVMHKINPSAVRKITAQVTFETHVDAVARKEFQGDTVKARAAILTNKAAHPSAWKAYVACRQVKHS